MDENKDKNAGQEMSEPEISAGTENKKSFLDKVREINERERKEELEREALEAKRRSEKKRADRENYEKKLNEERIELMKRKSGLVQEEKVKTEDTPKKKYTLKEKLENFVYHYKLLLLALSFIAIVAAFLIYDIVTKVEPDISVIIIARHEGFRTYSQNISDMLENYCEDYNGDGESSVLVSYLPAAVGEDIYSDMSMAERTKLFAEFQSATSVLVIADMESIEALQAQENVFADARDIFPGDENAEEHGYMLEGTDFAEETGFDDFPDGFFAAFREPYSASGIDGEEFRENFRRAVSLWGNYISGEPINKQ